MKWQAIARDWDYFLPMARRHWRAPTDAQMASVKGRYARLVECLQQSYGLSEEVIEEDIREWCLSFGEEDLPEFEPSAPLEFEPGAPLPDDCADRAPFALAVQRPSEVLASGTTGGA